MTGQARWARRPVKAPHELTKVQRGCLFQVDQEGETWNFSGMTRTSLERRGLITWARAAEGPRHPSVPNATWCLTDDGRKAVAYWVEWERTRPPPAR